METNPIVAERIQMVTNPLVAERIQKVLFAGRELEKSLFYKEALKQLEKPEMVAQINRVIATSPRHPQLQLVLYGLGQLEPVEAEEDSEDYSVTEYEVLLSCTQLAFAILLREKFEWINDIVVYDPLLSLNDEIAICAFDCHCLSVNENCRRTVDWPTLFFMPHCAHFLTENVLNANSTPANLNKIIILGNSLSRADPTFFHEKIESIFNRTHIQLEFPLRAADELTDIPVSNSIDWTEGKELDPNVVIHDAFRVLSWQFFVEKNVNGS